MDEQNLGRRGFLALLAGAVVAPVIRPKRSFFSFFVPETPLSVDLGQGEALQQAISRLGTKGGTIYLPTGIHIFQKALSIPGNVSLKGKGMIVQACAIHSVGPRSIPVFDVVGEGSAFMDSYFNLEGIKPGGCAIKGEGIEMFSGPVEKMAYELQSF